jgi:hypothetical protein
MFFKTGRGSHMNDSEMFLWLLDVYVREAVRGQREKLRLAGKLKEASDVVV